MSNNEQCINNVIVIGTGISGLAVAYELRQRGVSVRIIDKAKRPGEVWHHRPSCLNSPYPLLIQC